MEVHFQSQMYHRTGKTDTTWCWCPSLKPGVMGEPHGKKSDSRNQQHKAAKSCFDLMTTSTKIKTVEKKTSLPFFAVCIRDSNMLGFFSIFLPKILKVETVS